MTADLAAVSLKIEAEQVFFFFFFTLVAGPRRSLTRNPEPETRNPKPETRNPKPETRDPKPDPNPETRSRRRSKSGRACGKRRRGRSQCSSRKSTPTRRPIRHANPKPGTQNPEPGIRNPESGTRNPEPGTRNPRPETRNLKSGFRVWGVLEEEDEARDLPKGHALHQRRFQHLHVESPSIH